MSPIQLSLFHPGVYMDTQPSLGDPATVSLETKQKLIHRPENSLLSSLYFLISCIEPKISI